MLIEMLTLVKMLILIEMLMFTFVFVNDFVAEEEKLRLQLARSLVPGFHEINENGVML